MLGSFTIPSASPLSSTASAAAKPPCSVASQVLWGCLTSLVGTSRDAGSSESQAQAKCVKLCDILKRLQGLACCPCDILRTASP